MKMKYLWLAIATPALAAPAHAITIDGTRDPAYGQAIAVQTIDTGFGNQTSPNGLGGGGELDAAYATIQNGRLFLILTGNIENNFNKLSLFIDSKTGGENTLSANPQYDFENISQNFGGLTFDSGFQADYHLYARWGSFSGNVFTVDIVDRAGGSNPAVAGNGASSSTGAGTAIQTGTINPTDLGLGSTGVGEARNLSPFLNNPIHFGFNNTNTAGVGGNTGNPANQAAALAVTTGLELSIALADIGNPAPGDNINIHAVYGSSNNNFHSNQTLAGLPISTGNLGGNGSGGGIGNLSGINFNNFAGDQFFSITIPPAITGDLDADGFVGIADLNIVLANWNQSTPLANPQADPSNDNFVGIADLNIVLGNWNAGSPAPTTIPEPATCALIFLAAPALLTRRRSAHI